MIWVASGFEIEPPYTAVKGSPYRPNEFSLWEAVYCMSCAMLGGSISPAELLQSMEPAAQGSFDANGRIKFQPGEN